VSSNVASTIPTATGLALRGSSPSKRLIVRHGVDFYSSIDAEEVGVVAGGLQRHGHNRRLRGPTGPRGGSPRAAELRGVESLGCSLPPTNPGPGLGQRCR
jgi:hypothetical protein